MLGLKAKAGLLFFVSTGIFAGIVVFGNTVASKKIRPVPETSPSERIGQAEESLQDAIGTTKPSATLGVGSEAESTRETAPETSANLTRSLASLIGKSIVDKNPEGPAGDDITVMGADGVADLAAAESLKHFNPAYFSPEISISEVTIDNAQSATAYRASVEKITAETEAFSPKSGAPVAEKMKLLAKSYENATVELRALAVPQALAVEHMNTIRIAEGRRRILEAVADYENDPIYAMLALKLWDALK